MTDFTPKPRRSRHKTAVYNPLCGSIAAWERLKKRSRDMRAIQHQDILQDRVKCEICGWSAPAVLHEIAYSNFAVLTANHHIVPVCCNGTEEPDNLIRLCPNHHAIADLLVQRRYNRTTHRHTMNGPMSRAELVASIQLLETDPARWLATYPDNETSELIKGLSNLYHDKFELS